MRVLLDGQPLSPPPDSVESLLRSALSQTQDRGRMIVDILADGRRLSDQELQDPLRALAGAGLVEITSASPYAMVAQSLSSASEALDSVIGRQQEVAERIHAGNTESALDGLREVLTTWQLVRDVIERGGAVLETDFSGLRLPGIDAARPVETATAALSSVLSNLMDGLTREDWSQVGDVMAYDLDALAKDWRTILRALAEHVASSGGPPGSGGYP